MSSIAPPNPYFSGINFNPKFFRSIYDYLTEQIADTLYLKLRGGSLSGNLGIKKSPANVELDIIGKANIGGLVGAPSNGLYGGNGTRLILLNGSTTSTPSAIGYNTNKLWVGSSGTDNISFYTGVTERMTIRNDGKVGIGTTDPNSSGVSTIYSDAQTQARLILTGREYYTGATTSANGIAFVLGVNRTNNKQLWIGDSEKLFVNTTNSVLRFNVGGTGETGIDSYATDGVTPFKLGLNGSIFIKSDGKVGIGKTEPANILQVGEGGRLRISNSSTDYSIIGTQDIDNALNTRIVLSGNDRPPYSGNIEYYSTTGGSHIFYSTNTAFTERMRIKSNGNVGIGNNDPGNILQVGDGSRFRIANNSDDYSAIGTKEIDDVNNTSILMYGYTHANALRKGCVEYVASTATGTHDFFMNGSTALAVSMTPDDFKITTSCSVYNNNYYTDGEYTTYQSRINALGAIKNGYFITTEYFFNSLVMCAFSHLDGSNNRYWFGHVGTSNLTTVIFIQSLSSASMNAEPFIEQTTNKNYIYVYPTGTYSTGVNLRLKFYG